MSGYIAMKALLANKYFFLKGGAENSFFETGGLLERKGHRVVYFSMQHERNLESPYTSYFVSNVDYDKGGLAEGLRSAGRMLYSREAERKIDALIRRERPDVAHLNNIYHQISPSILVALRRHKIPTVMTLRDYKVVCGSYSMIDSKGICEACKDGRYHQAIARKCVKGSLAKSALTAAEMYLHHTVLKLYNLVDVYISPSRFLKDKVAQMGFKKRVEYLPNFTSLTGTEPNYDRTERSVVYFGRISREKGLGTLIDAVKSLPDLTLKVIGEGPARTELEERARREGISNVRFLGYRKGKDLYDEISGAMMLALPSEWYENNPRTLIEGFALGKPAVGAAIGGIPELIRDGETGWTYPMGDATRLSERLRWMLEHPDEVRRMGRNARHLVATELDAERHYTRLMEIYRSIGVRV